MTDQSIIEDAKPIMAQAQVYASAWSLVGGPFDSGDELENAELAKLELQNMVEKALREARQSSQSEPVLYARESDIDHIFKLKGHSHHVVATQTHSGDGVYGVPLFLAAPQQAIPSGWIESIIRDVAELPDRNSPDDFPEAMLVTAAELEEIILRHTASATAPIESDKL
jgi:hypothetical protein